MLAPSDGQTIQRATTRVRPYTFFEMFRELTCKELVELVSDYFEDAQPPDERARFEAHLERCDGCDRYVEQMHATIRALGALSENDVPPEAQAKLLQAFRNFRT